MPLYALGQLCAFDRYYTEGVNCSGTIDCKYIIGVWHIGEQRWVSELLMNRLPADWRVTMKARHAARTGVAGRMIVSKSASSSDIDEAYFKKVESLVVIRAIEGPPSEDLTVTREGNVAPLSCPSC